jgi:hypothetical protein
MGRGTIRIKVGHMAKNGYLISPRCVRILRLRTVNSTLGFCLTVQRGRSTAASFASGLNLNLKVGTFSSRFSKSDNVGASKSRGADLDNIVKK